MFEWLFRKKEQRSYENPATPLWTPNAYEYLVGPRSSAGVAVNRMTVLGLPAVWRCLNLISHKVGRLPLKTYQVDKGGSRTEARYHPAWRLIMQAPSDLYTPFHWKSTMMQHALWHGNSYSHIFRDPVTNAPEELVILNPERVFPVMDNGKLIYVARLTDAGNKDVKILPENMIHFKGLSADGIVGYCVIDVLREALGIPLAAQRYASRFYRNSTAPGPIILKMPGYLKDEEQVKRFREMFSGMHQGIDNAHKVMLLEQGMDFANFSPDLQASQFLETRKFEVAMVAACIFGVPVHKLGVEGPADSYNSIESEERAFLSDCLDAWLVMVEQELTTKLLTTVQTVRQSHYLEFDRRSLQAADAKSLADALASEVNNGLRTVNEGRAMLNLPADETPEADKLRKPMNVGYIDTPIGRQPQTNVLPGEESEPVSPGSAEGDKEVPDTVEPVPLDARTFAMLQEELAAVLPEQRDEVFKRWRIIGKTV